MSDAPAPDNDLQHDQDADHPADATTADAPTAATHDADADTPADATHHADPAATVDLGAVEHDLNAVETALARLSDGTYYTDEVTGQPLSDDLLAADPMARRA